MGASGRCLLTSNDPQFADAVARLSATGNPPGAEPAAIARPGTPDQVCQALAVAADNGWTVVSRGGGHSLSSNHSHAGSLVLDLRQMTQVTWTSTGTVRLAAGLTSGAAAAAVHRAGKALSVGHVGAVGLGGFLMAGGNGWPIGGARAACSQVVAAQVVTADGHLRWVNQVRERDLWWAVRGGAGVFAGVVTAFELAVEPVAPQIVRYRQTLPIARHAELGAALDDGYVGGAPVDDRRAQEVTVLAHLAAPEPTLSVTVTVFLNQGQVATPGHSTAPPDWQHFAGLPDLLAALPNFAVDAQASHHLFTQASWSRVLAALAAQADRTAADVPAVLPQSSVVISPTPISDPSALYCPPAGLSVSAYGHSYRDDVQGHSAARWWVRRIIAGLENSLAPNECGAPRRYIGEVDATGDAQWIRDCFRPQDLQRLAALRTRYDPQGRFVSLLDP